MTGRCSESQTKQAKNLLTLIYHESVLYTTCDAQVSCLVLGPGVKTLCTKSPRHKSIHALISDHLENNVLVEFRRRDVRKQRKPNLNFSFHLKSRKLFSFVKFNQYFFRHRFESPESKKTWKCVKNGVCQCGTSFFEQKRDFLRKKFKKKFNDKGPLVVIKF